MTFLKFNNRIYEFVAILNTKGGLAIDNDEDSAIQIKIDNQKLHHTYLYPVYKSDAFFINFNADKAAYFKNVYCDKIDNEYAYLKFSSYKNLDDLSFLTEEDIRAIESMNVISKFNL
jgi:hypothetical protein